MSKWLVFLTLSVWFYMAAHWMTWRRRKIQERLREVLPSQAAKTENARKRKLSMRFAARKLSFGWVKRSTRNFDKVQTRLAQAGNPFNLTVAEWIGLRFIFTGVGALTGAAVLIVSGGKITGLLIFLAGLLLGWIGPDFWLSRRITARQTAIIREFPNVLDLLTVSVEAGLGFDQAMSRVSTKMKGALSEEFDRALREVQLGSQREQALQRLGTRIGLDAVKSFVSAVIQADKLGIGMAQVLRVQSDEVRRKRRMDAEERAMKAPVKMLFPLVLFVFPALFIVILGPAVLHMVVLFGHG